MIARGKNSNSLVNQAFIMTILSHLIVSAFKSIKIKNTFTLKPTLTLTGYLLKCYEFLYKSQSSIPILYNFYF